MKVVFLDRDGVISQDRPDYITSWKEFEFIPRSLEAIKVLSANGFAPIVITNQSAVNRGRITRNTLTEIHDKMTDAITSHGGRIEAIYVCPHTPDNGCNCRKPKPGLILQAQKNYNLDLSSIPMIGDDKKDIVAAREAGCGMAILVRTGKGKETEKRLREEGIDVDYVADDLLDAVKWLIGHEPISS
jgi:D-glycero-D-manno-heptose 1,7-bisphosphate phosphatase